jgi:hypothetical protein
MNPVFCTTEPAPFGMHGETFTAPAQVMRDAKDNPPRHSDTYPFYASGYLHGELEGEAGYDVPILVSGEFPDSVGEYECQVYVTPRKLANAILVIWDTGKFRVKKESGLPEITSAAVEGAENKPYLRYLIVAADDTKALKYARTSASKGDIAL